MGLALSVAAIRSCANTLAAARERGNERRVGRLATDQCSTAQRWLILTAGGVLLLGSLSAMRNHSLALSWGWLVRFASGAGWALLLARTLSARHARRVILGLGAVALLAVGLTLADRSDRGLADFNWPMGTVTAVGALTAAWASVTAAMVIGQFRSRQVIPSTAFCAIVAAAATYTLWQTQRRAPAVGLVAGTTLAVSILLWLRFRSKARALAIALLCLVAADLGALYTYQRLTRSFTEPLGLRATYWRLSAGLVAQRPLLGYGPETFLVHMTNTLAPLRARSPTVYRGDIDFYAHNEWVQAAVELGLPGAIMYFALPIGIIVLAIRRLRPKPSFDAADGDGGRPESQLIHRAAVLAMIAGLVSIMVTECASITLRFPTVPVWYWTFLGLLLGLSDSRQTTPREPPAPASRWASTSRIPALAAAATACWLALAAEVVHASNQARETVTPRTMSLTRLFIDSTFAALNDNAIRASAVAHERRRPEDIETAESLWKELHTLMPGLRDIPARYADILILAGKREAAKSVLEDALSERINPFNVTANTLYARFIADDPLVKLRCVQRALRSGALNESLRTILAEVLTHTTAMEALEQDLPLARSVASAPPDESAADAAVELLRISAFARERSEGPSTAIADQRLAADFYRRLDAERSRYRRQLAAEADAFAGLARLLYAAGPDNSRQAYDAIIVAERHALLNIEHRSLAHPKPEEGFLCGEVLPLEFPAELHPLWRLSALLHVAVGDERHLSTRVLMSMPQEEWRDEMSVWREIAAVYRQAANDLGALPPSERPAHYGRIRSIAAAAERAASGQILPPTSQRGP